QQSPNYLVQVSKSILINLYVISSFETKINGNLLVTLSTGEQQIVSRKFVTHLRKQLKAFSLTS
ncbi:LytTR family DNA-binding domain-containing protein, partial [Oenococcus oeni]